MDFEETHYKGEGKVTADSVHFKVLVPSIAAGSIIGRGGETIAQLQKDTNAKVKMSKANDFYPGTTERVCLIVGNVEAILRVHSFIMEKIYEKPDPTLRLFSAQGGVPGSSPGATGIPVTLTSETSTPTPSLTTAAGSGTSPAIAIPTMAMTHGVSPPHLTSASASGMSSSVSSLSGIGMSPSMLPSGAGAGPGAGAGVGSGASVSGASNAELSQAQLSRLLLERHKQVKILVPNSTAGMIIGKGGTFIKELKEATGAFIQISQKARDMNLQERCITIAGEVDQNRKAIEIILKKIAEDPQSASCPMISYQDYSGPVPNAYPTGSPYATALSAASSAAIAASSQTSHVASPAPSSNAGSLAQSLQSLSIGAGIGSLGLGAGLGMGVGPVSPSLGVGVGVGVPVNPLVPHLASQLSAQQLAGQLGGQFGNLTLNPSGSIQTLHSLSNLSGLSGPGVHSPAHPAGVLGIHAGPTQLTPLGSMASIGSSSLYSSGLASGGPVSPSGLAASSLAGISGIGIAGMPSGTGAGTNMPLFGAQTPTPVGGSGVSNMGVPGVGMGLGLAGLPGQSLSNSLNLSGSWGSVLSTSTAVTPTSLSIGPSGTLQGLQTTGPLPLGMGLGIGTGGSNPVSSAIASGNVTQNMLETFMGVLRSSGYSDAATEEILYAMCTLANYGFLNLSNWNGTSTLVIGGPASFSSLGTLGGAGGAAGIGQGLGQLGNLSGLASPTGLQSANLAGYAGQQTFGQLGPGGTPGPLSPQLSLMQAQAQAMQVGTLNYANIAGMNIAPVLPQQSLNLNVGISNLSALGSLALSPGSSFTLGLGAGSTGGQSQTQFGAQGHVSGQASDYTIISDPNSLVSTLGSQQNAGMYSAYADPASGSSIGMVGTGLSSAPGTGAGMLIGLGGPVPNQGLLSTAPPSSSIPGAGAGVGSGLSPSGVGFPQQHGSMQSQFPGMTTTGHASRQMSLTQQQVQFGMAGATVTPAHARSGDESGSQSGSHSRSHSGHYTITGPNQTQGSSSTQMQSLSSQYAAQITLAMATQGQSHPSVGSGGLGQVPGQVVIQQSHSSALPMHPHAHSSSSSGQGSGAVPGSVSAQMLQSQVSQRMGMPTSSNTTPSGSTGDVNDDSSAAGLNMGVGLQSPVKPHVQASVSAAMAMPNSRSTRIIEIDESSFTALFSGPGGLPMDELQARTGTIIKAFKASSGKRSLQVTGSDVNLQQVFNYIRSPQAQDSRRVPGQGPIPTAQACTVPVPSLQMPLALPIAAPLQVPMPLSGAPQPQSVRVMVSLANTQVPGSTINTIAANAAAPGVVPTAGAGAGVVGNGGVLAQIGTQRPPISGAYLQTNA